MKYVKSIFHFIFAIPYVIWSTATRRAYYVTGTFLDMTGKRMFFKTTFISYRNVFPIQSLEKNMAKEFNANGIIILFFHRIPWGMVKYVEADYDDNIEIKKKHYECKRNRTGVNL